MADKTLNVLSQKTTAAAGDFMLLRDTTSGTDKKVAVSGLASAVAANLPATSVAGSALNLSKTTDANGWTVYNYGNWKEYEKMYTGLTVNASTGFRYTLVTANLPSDLANVSLAYWHVTFSSINAAGRYTIGVSTDLTTTSTTFVVSVGNYTGSNLNITDGQLVIRAKSK